PALAEQPLVLRVQRRELQLALGLRPLGVVAGLGGERLRVAPVVRWRHHLVLEPVDPRDEAAQQRRRIAADLVTTESELVDVVEQEREPVRRRNRDEEGIDARLESLVAKQSRAEGVEGGDPELLPRGLDARLEPLAHLRGRAVREGQREDAV